MNSDPLIILDKYLSPVEEGLTRLSLKTEPAALYDPCRYTLAGGGKRIRPILTLIGCGICGGDTKKALNAALAIELIHNFTLVHDDIMDQAGERRGRASVHVKWNESTAILAGDILFVEACKLLNTYVADSTMSKELFARLSGTYLSAISDVCEGQAMDMDFEKSESVKSEEYLDMIGRKTAALISASLVLGGLTAGGSEEDLQRLQKAGTDAGMAFQIQDDLLDVVANPEKFGKVKGGDLREGKKTYLLLLAFERCNGEDLSLLKRLIKKELTSDRDVETITGIFRKYGVMESAEELLNRYYQSALESVETFAESDYKHDLSTLITHLKQREY